MHAIVDQLLWLSRAFPGRFADGVPQLDLPLFPDVAGGVVSKKAMAETIVAAADRLGVRDSTDGTLKVTGHSLRSTGAQGLIRLKWRPDAVRLMGRWESEVVRAYTRLAPLESPTEPALPEELVRAFMELTGVARSSVPPAPPWIPKPEPRLEAIPEAEWIYHVAPDKYHLAGPTAGRARCGWDFARAEIHRGVAPPPWYWVLCSGCSPGIRARLKAEAEAAAVEVKRASD